MISIHDVIAFMEYELALRAVHPADSAKPPGAGSLAHRRAGATGPADIRHRQSESPGPNGHGRRERAG